MQSLKLPAISKLKLRRSLKDRADKMLPLDRVDFYVVKVSFNGKLRHTYYLGRPVSAMRT